MWQNLSDDVRKAIEAAGPAPGVTLVTDLENYPEHYELFFQYFNDNCSDADALNVWSCFWWLTNKDLSLRPYGRRGNRAVEVDQFWEAFGPDGASPIAWPAEVTDWFAQSEQWDAAVAGAWRPAWDDEEDPSGPEWDAYSELADQRAEWSAENPVPLRAAFEHSHRTVREWYRAFADEVARMAGLAMTYADLDLDYIDSLNTYNLDQLPAGEGVTCLGHGPYVLIGEFPPGYVNAVASYDQSWWGTVTMTAKGSRFNPGTVTITGCDGDNQRWFKEAFRRVSKKAVKYE